MRFISSDYNLWKQIHDCGQIVSIYKLRKQRKLIDLAITSSNAFDLDKKESFLFLNAVEKEKKSNRVKGSSDPSAEDDPEIQAEIRKGNKVEVNVDYTLQ